MFSNEIKLTDDETLEIRIVPIGNTFLIQIASDPIRGTLVLTNDIEEEELVEFSRALHAMVEHLQMGANNSSEVGS